MTTFTKLVAAVMCVGTMATVATANPGMTAPTPSAPPAHHRPTPRYHPPVRPVPPIRVLPPVVVRPPVAPPVVVAAPAAPASSGVLTNGAWVAYNSQTGMYSVAFDSPGVSGLGILINAGYNVVVRGPTTWTDATEYLKSIGAPGW